MWRRSRSNAHQRCFDEFFAGDYARVLAAVQLLTGEEQRARDAVDEAVARAWDQLSRGREIENLGGWVRVVAFNVARTDHRRAAREAQAHVDVRVQPTTEPDTGTRVDVERALAALTARQREIVVLFYFADLSVSDIASELGVGIGTVKATLHRARSIMTVLLQDAGDTDVAPGDTDVVPGDIQASVA